MAKQLTPAEVAALPVRSRAYDVGLGGVPGLIVRVLPTGTKSIRLRYQMDGHRRWLALGTFPSMRVAVARREARRYQGLIAMGRDPAFERREGRRVRRERGSVSDMVSRYLEEYAVPRKRSASEDTRLLNKEIVARFGHLPADQLTRGHILEIIDHARRRGMSGGLNNLFAIIRKMLNWAVSVGILASNPANGIQRPAPLRTRDRILTREELGSYWSGLASANCDDRTRLALQIQALTGLRIGEVTNARRLEVQLSERKFVIPAERMKTKRPHSVPMSDAVLELFRRALATTPQDSPYVFSSETTGSALRAQSVMRALNRLQPYFGFSKPFTTHDLRRTMATVLIEIGEQPAVVDRLLAHVPSGVLDRHYNLHAYGREKRCALERWAEVVHASAESVAVAQ